MYFESFINELARCASLKVFLGFRLASLGGDYVILTRARFLLYVASRDKS